MIEMIAARVPLLSTVIAVLVLIAHNLGAAAYVQPHEPIAANGADDEREATIRAQLDVIEIEARAVKRAIMQIDALRGRSGCGNEIARERIEIIARERSVMEHELDALVTDALRAFARARGDAARAAAAARVRAVHDAQGDPARRDARSATWTDMLIGH